MKFLTISDAQFMKIRLFGCLSIVMVTVLFSGCNLPAIDSVIPGASSNIENVVSGVKDGAQSAGEMVIGGADNFLKQDVPRTWYFICQVCKRWIAAVIVGSVLFGVLLNEVFKTLKEVQKFAWVTLIVKIPLLSFLSIYVMAALYGVIGGKYGYAVNLSGAWCTIPDAWNALCGRCMAWAPWVMSGSILSGIAVYEIFKSNKEIRRFAYGVLMFKVPIVLFIFVYLYSFLYWVFN